MTMFITPPEGVESCECHEGFRTPLLQFPSSVWPEGALIEYIGSRKLTKWNPPPWVSQLQ